MGSEDNLGLVALPLVGHARPLFERILGAESGVVFAGAAPNEPTSTGDRDPFVGTPWHKHVPARLERL